MSELSNRIMRDLAAAGFAEYDGDKDVYFWTADGRREYGGDWRHVENYALSLADQVKRIYGPTGMVGAPKDFGTIEIKLLDLPEVVEMVETARSQQKKAAPIFMTGLPLAAVFQTSDEDYYFTDGKIHIEGKSRANAFKQLAAAVKRENPGREVLSLYLADGSSNIIFDEPGRPPEEHSLFGTLRQLIKWIGARVHNDKLRRQLASELMINALFTFDDLAFAVYKSEDGKFYCWNGTDNFETHKDAAAAMLDFIKGQDEDSETVKTSDIMFGVVRTEGSDFDLYTANEDMQGEYFDSTAELPNAAATLANHLYNEYKATPFGNLADKVVVLTRQTNGDFMAALEGHDGPIGGPFRKVAPEVLKVIAGLADGDQKAQFAEIFATGGKIETEKMKLLLTGIVQTEADKYLVKTGPDDYRKYDNRADAEAAYKAHFLSDKIFEAGLKSVLAAPPVKPATEHLIAGVFHKDGGRYELRGSVVGKAEAVESVMLTEVLTNLQTWLNGYDLFNRPSVKLAVEDRPTFDFHRWIRNMEITLSPAGFREAVKKTIAELKVAAKLADERDNGDLLLLGLYQKPASVGGYYMTGAVPAVEFSTRNSGQVMSMMRMYLENWYENEAHYPDPNGRIVVGLDPAGKRQDDMVIAIKQAYPDAFPLYAGGGAPPVEPTRPEMLMTGIYELADGSVEYRRHDRRIRLSSFTEAAKLVQKDLTYYGAADAIGDPVRAADETRKVRPDEILLLGIVQKPEGGFDLRGRFGNPGKGGSFGTLSFTLEMFLTHLMHGGRTISDPVAQIAEAAKKSIDPRVTVARQVVGFYDYGDDGKTFFVSSELPGRTGALTFSSRSTAADRAAKVITDYLGRFGLPVARWNGYGQDLGPAQRPTGAVSSFGPFDASPLVQSEAQRRQEYEDREVENLRQENAANSSFQKELFDRPAGTSAADLDYLGSLRDDPEEPADDEDEGGESTGRDYAGNAPDEDDELTDGGNMD